MNTKINPLTDALIVIDVQNDFCPGGLLEVKEGDSIIPSILKIAKEFKTIIFSQDFHPKGHASFASTQGKPPYSEIELPYGMQTLWPDHCIQGSKGSEFHDDIKELLNRTTAIIRKGMNPEIDSYSAFFENDRETSTGLSGLLRDKGISRVFFVGLAYDFCVGYSAIDAKELSFDSVVLKDCTRAIDIPKDFGTTVELIEENFDEVGVEVSNSIDYMPVSKLKASKRTV